jgi:PTH1 family peptidyl-tRNA hydrolase
MHYLIVGLGNPGKEHQLHRHNIGFMAVEKIAQQLSSSGAWSNKMGAESFTFQFNSDSKVTLIKPMSYMNLSGRAVQAYMSFFKLNIENIWVFHDDIDLEFLRVKVKQGGGHGGHNGLRSIDSCIGVHYHRVRLGVGRPQFGDVSNFVLGNFASEQMTAVELVLSRISANLPTLLNGRKDRFIEEIIKPDTPTN